MEQMLEFPEQFQPHAHRSLTFIRYQLKDLTDYCDEMLQHGWVKPQGFLRLDELLQKVLHDTRAVCNPPPKKPKKSDFDLVKCIGTGSFGTVNQVRHKQTGQSFAMKEIKQDDWTRDSVLKERDILNFLQHPLFVPMYCSFETESHQYMVMEYVTGGDFCNLMQQFNNLFLEESRFYIAELILAVEHLHKFGILHRDLKLANLLISSQGHLKLVDFGLSKLGSVAMVDHHTRAEVAREFTDGENCGTCFYMAPELLLGEGYGKPIDWWAVGVILYFFLTGTYPFYGETSEEYIQQAIEGYICWSEKIANESWDILSRLLDTDPAWRLGTRGASEVKQHPFFKDVDWQQLIYQTPPCVPELEDESSCFQMSPSPVLREDQSTSPVDAADFCYVGKPFREVYGSLKPLSSDTLLNRFPLAIMSGPSKEQQELEEMNESFLTKSPLSKIPVRSKSPLSRNMVRMKSPLSRIPVRSKSPLSRIPVRSKSPLSRSLAYSSPSPLSLDTWLNCIRQASMIIPSEEQQELEELEEGFVGEEQQHHLLDHHLVEKGPKNKLFEDTLEEGEIDPNWSWRTTFRTSPHKPTVEESDEDEEPTVIDSGKDEEPTVGDSDE